MPKYKYNLMRARGKTLDDLLKNKIKEFIKEKDVSGEYAQFSIIVAMIRKDIKVSKTKIRSILDELAKNRKISTVYDQGNRYYGVAKIPLPIKVFIGMITSILFFYLLVDILIPDSLIISLVYLYSPINETTELQNINVFLFALIGIITTSIISAIWFYDYKKTYK